MCREIIIIMDILPASFRYFWERTCDGVPLETLIIIAVGSFVGGACLMFLANLIVEKSTE